MDHEWILTISVYSQKDIWSKQRQKLIRGYRSIWHEMPRNSCKVEYIIKHIDSQSKEEEQIGNITNVSDLTSEIIGKQKINRKISFGSIGMYYLTITSKMKIVERIFREMNCVFPKPMTSLFQKCTFRTRKSVSFTVAKADLLGWTTGWTCFQFDVFQHNPVILPSSRTSSDSKYQTSIKCPSQQVTHL